MRLLLLSLIAWALPAQVVATFSQQGPEALKALTGKQIDSVAVVSVRACNISPGIPVTISISRILQVGETRGVVVYQTLVAEAILARTSKRSRAQRVADYGQGMSLIGAGLAASQRAGPGVTGALIGGATVAHWLAGKLQEREPDLSLIRAGTLQREASNKNMVTLAAHECAEGIELGRYVPGLKPVTAVIESF